MSFVSQLNPEGKEIEIGGKKYTQNTKITFNMKAFVSLVIIIGTLFGATYYLIDERLDSNEDKHDEQINSVTLQLDQIKDENLIELKEKVDATNGKMELLMLLINSNQININNIPPTNPVTDASPEEVTIVEPSETNRLINLNDLDTINN